MVHDSMPITLFCEVKANASQSLAAHCVLHDRVATSVFSMRLWNGLCQGLCRWLAFDTQEQVHVLSRAIWACFTMISDCTWTRALLVAQHKLDMPQLRICFPNCPCYHMGTLYVLTVCTLSWIWHQLGLYQFISSCKAHMAFTGVGFPDGQDAEGPAVPGR